MRLNRFESVFTQAWPKHLHLEREATKYNPSASDIHDGRALEIASARKPCAAATRTGQFASNTIGTFNRSFIVAMRYSIRGADIRTYRGRHRLTPTALPPL